MQEYRRTVKDIDLKGKRVMVRAGLDVPFDFSKDLLDPNRVADDTRIKDIIPTIRCLIENDAKIILAAGWAGRPNGVDPNYSLAPVAKRLEMLLKNTGLLKYPVLIAPDCFKDKNPRSVYRNKGEVREIMAELKPGQIVVMENVRYDPEANANDIEFAAFFASLADVYVNEAETQNHRREATIVTTPLLIAKKGGDVVYGLKYVDVLDKIGSIMKKLQDKKRGYFVLGLSGKKIESDPGIISKITVADKLIEKMRNHDVLIIGGGVTYTFILAKQFKDRIEPHIKKINEIVKVYDKKIASETKIDDKEKAALTTEQLQNKKSQELKAQIGIEDQEIKRIIGNSYIRWGQEGEQIVFAYNLMAKAAKNGIKVIVASDHIIANMLPDKGGVLPRNAKIEIYREEINIPEGWSGVGEGPNTISGFCEEISNAAIFLQSGPFSIEDERVEKISKNDSMIFEAVKKCKDEGGTAIGAGGDTVTRINTFGAEESFSIITSAGGATLELIQTGTSKGKEAVEIANRLKK